MAAVLIILGIIVLLLIGWAVVGLVFNLLWWVLIGVLIGALARLVLPGQQTIGWLGTAGSGIAGSLLGGILADVFGTGSIVQFLLAIAVAALLIVVFSGTQAARSP